MSGPYNNRSRGRGGNRPYNNQNNKTIRRTHDYQQQYQPQHQVSNSNSKELSNGVYGNERFMHTTMALIGAIARVTVKSGKVYEGVFKTYSPEFEVVLDRVHEVDPENPDTIPFKEEIKAQMVFKLEDIASVLYRNVDPYYAIADGFTDAAISRKTNGQAMEKELQPWVSDVSPDEILDDDDVLDGGKSNGWDAMDMFRTNRDKFQIESTYDPNMGQYTTPLPTHNTEDFKVYEENAAAVAREIESSALYRQRVDLENTKDEETLHSAVVRDLSSSSSAIKSQQREGRVLQHPERVVSSASRGGKSFASTSLAGEQSPGVVQQAPEGAVDVSETARRPSAGSAQGHVLLPGVPPVAATRHPARCSFSTSSRQGSQDASRPVGTNGFEVPDQRSPRPAGEWKEPTSDLQRASCSTVSQMLQAGEVASGMHHRHYQHHQQQQQQRQLPSHCKDVEIADKIKDLKDFHENFNLTDASAQSSSSQQQPPAQAVAASAENVRVQASHPVVETTECTPRASILSAPVVAAPVPSDGASAVEGPPAVDIVEGQEKKKEPTYTLNPNAHEFRPRNVPPVSMEPVMTQMVQSMQVMPAAVAAAANLPQQQQQQQQQVQGHLHQHKSNPMGNGGGQVGTPQAQQMVPSAVGSTPIIYQNPGFMTPHPTSILYYPQTTAPRYHSSTKRATVSARGNSEGGTPQGTGIMAGAPLISQNGLPPMFVAPQQMMINSSYLSNQLRFMTPCPVILEHVPNNPMLLSASMMPPLAAPPHGTPTAVMHPLLQQQQQIVAQQPQQASNNSNGSGGGRPNSNGSGAPTPVHYQSGHPGSQQPQTHGQGVPHHQQQQQQQQQQTPNQIYAAQGHGNQQQQMTPSGPPSQMANSMQSQMLFSPFVPAFAGHHHPQSGGFAAAMPPPSISGQGQVPPGAALHPHQLVQHQFQPMIIASQNQQAAAAQLGQFVALPGLAGVPQAPPNIASPQFYGMPPIQSSMTGQNFQHGQ